MYTNKLSAIIESALTVFSTSYKTIEEQSRRRIFTERLLRSRMSVSLPSIMLEDKQQIQWTGNQFGLIINPDMTRLVACHPAWQFIIFPCRGGHCEHRDALINNTAVCLAQNSPFRCLSSITATQKSSTRCNLWSTWHTLLELASCLVGRWGLDE